MPRSRGERTAFDERTPGHLAGERHQAARSKDQADIELRPRMRGEVDGHKRAEAGLDIGEKEREPVEAALAGRQIRALPRTPPPCEERRNTAAARRSFRPPLKSSGIATNKKISGAHEITFGRMARL